MFVFETLIHLYSVFTSFLPISLFFNSFHVPRPSPMHDLLFYHCCCYILYKYAQYTHIIYEKPTESGYYCTYLHVWRAGILINTPPLVLRS